MEDRALVGKIAITDTCEFEFVPASTSVKYKCELVGTFGSLRVVSAINRNEYVVVNKWVWLTASATPTIAIDAGSVGLNPNSTEPSEFQSSVAKSVTGQVRSVSTFLRIKDTNDPFHNSFCVHLVDGESVVFRGRNLVLFKHFFEPGTVVEFVNFRKIKLKSFNDKIVSISVDESIVAKVNKLDLSLVRGSVSKDSLTTGTRVRGRVVAIDPPHVWITPLSEIGPKCVLPLVMNRWGICDKRKISLGAVVVVHNFHFVHGVIGFCPATTLLVVEELPSIAAPVALHSLCSSPSDRCLVHNIDGTSACSANAFEKFGINTLCACDCVIQCDAVNDHLVKTLTQLSQLTQSDQKIVDTKPSGPDRNELFKNALQSAEVCLSVVNLEEILLLKAPPFFNVSLERPVQVTVTGPPSPEITQYMKSFPSALYFSIFPRNRPINAFMSATLHSQTADRRDVSLRVLVPRDASVSIDAFFLIQQMLVVNCEEAGPVHAIILTAANLHRTSDVEIRTQMETISSPARTKYNRRLLLRNQIWDSTV